MTRDEITQQIIAARLAKGLTWQQLADAIGTPVVWTTAALLGQHPIPSEQARTVAELLGLDASVVPCSPPSRCAAACPPRCPPTDHLSLLRSPPGLRRRNQGAHPRRVRRRHHERINFSVNLEKKSNPAGDRVVVTLDGKFLPYDWTAADTAG